MKASEFIKGKDFSTSKGLPEGKTLIDLGKAEFNEKTFTDDDGTTKVSNQVKIGNETYNLPMSVMNKIKQAVELGGFMVEVNREGTGRQNTKYVSYILDANGKELKK
jgi:hypothetical protein